MKKVTKKSKKTKAVDTKMAQANDTSVQPEVQAPVVKLPAAGDSAVKSGAIYAVLAGRPSKQAVMRVFGKAGYALSWIARAERLNVTPESLTEAFAADPEHVKTQWEALPPKERKQKATTAVA